MDQAGRSEYALGHSDTEMDRLSAQARALEPFTRRMFRDAGLCDGMRVLDVGSGSGDVAFLAASAVGPSGEVLGIDRVPAAVETAGERARKAGYQNVKFIAGDLFEMSFPQPFDAVVGRLVLMHQPDPVAMLRKLSSLARPGAIFAFQEYDISAARSYPHLEIFEQCLQWLLAAFERAGTDVRMGLKLYSAFVAAGLPAPSMSLDALIGGGPDNPGSALVPDVIRSLLPALERFGIATAAQVGIDSLRERMQAAVVAEGGIVISPSLIGAWCKRE